MRSASDIENPVLDTSNELFALSIVIDDFDSTKTASEKELKAVQETTQHQQVSSKPYSRQSSDVSIKKILEEVEHRKHEFWKLIDEHNAVIEDLKRIEQLEHNNVCKLSQSPIRT